MADAPTVSVVVPEPTPSAPGSDEPVTPQPGTPGVDQPGTPETATAPPPDAPGTPQLAFTGASLLLLLLLAVALLNAGRRVLQHAARSIPASSADAAAPTSTRRTST